MTIATLVLAGMIGFGAASAMTRLYEPPAPSDLEFPSLQPEVYREAVKSMGLAELAALDSMKGSRTAILLGLWAVSALVFVSSLRMLRPRGAPREGVRRVLGTSLVVSAVLRTLDGAQAAAAATRAGRAFDQVMSKSNEIPGGWADGVGAFLWTGSSIAATFVVGGSLLLLARYYRSDRIREVCIKLDEQSPS